MALSKMFVLLQSESPNILKSSSHCPGKIPVRPGNVWPVDRDKSG